MKSLPTALDYYKLRRAEARWSMLICRMDYRIKSGN
jgi:hypothetical protein